MKLYLSNRPKQYSFLAPKKIKTIILIYFRISFRYLLPLQDFFHLLFICSVFEKLILSALNYEQFLYVMFKSLHLDSQMIFQPMDLYFLLHFHVWAVFTIIFFLISSVFVLSSPSGMIIILILPFSKELDSCYRIYSFFKKMLFLFFYMNHLYIAIFNVSDLYL